MSEKKQQAITAYKGFDANWTCAPSGGNAQTYKVGATYTMDGPIELCARGFHACEYPLDVFGYYPPTGKLAVVELDGVSPERRDDSKVVGSKITIRAQLDIVGLVKAAIEYTTTRCDPVKAQHSVKDRSASSATGDQAIAAAFGLESKACAGKTGVVIVAWWDRKADRKRVTTGYVGENGIKADVFYRCDDAGKLIEA